ncbi:MAG: hypothetical protein IPK82_39520 [Polyangiaceae bacterium]|nr:hypothetical protein [Polyangiaceae bacterium]
MLLASLAWAKRALAFGALIAGTALSLGCVRTETPVTTGPSQILAGVSAQGLDLPDPLLISQGAIDEVNAKLASISNPNEKLRALRDLLYTKAERPFVYAPHLTLTADTAWRERRGDCLAFSMMFLALARHASLPVYFVHVRDAESYYERGGELFVSSHVAVGIGVGPNAHIYDFKKEFTDWRLSIYQRVDDETARAFYFNNVAVDFMTNHRFDDAKKLFEVLATRAPAVSEPLNNYGVLLLRQDKNEQALSVLRRGIEKFPNQKPLYINAILAAARLGKADEVARLESDQQRVLRNDPVYLFGRGMRFLSRRAYTAAVDDLSRARDSLPDSAVVLAALGRAQVAAGELDEGQRTLEEARAKATGSLRHIVEGDLADVAGRKAKQPAAQ